MSWSPNFRPPRSLYKLVVRNSVVVLLVSLMTAFLLQGGFGEYIAYLRVLRPIHIFLAQFLPAATGTYYYLINRKDAYLVDYACFKPLPNSRVPLATFKEHMHLMPLLDHRSIDFLTRVIEHSGLGEETCFPSSQLYMPTKSGLSEARAESELIIFSAIDDLFSKTCIDPTAIGILVVNCSGFSPSPSLCDMIISKYKLCGDIHSLNLSGMGCSASLISVGLVKNLLQISPYGTYALVVSTEITSGLRYQGRKRAMHLPSILFRMGGAVALLSNSKVEAKYRLKHLLRNMSNTESAYRCVILEEDEHGKLGLNLSRDIIAASGDALKASLGAIGPHILPSSEKLLFLFTYITHKVLKNKTKIYVPNFSKATEHFCIHPGGPKVIDEVQNNLYLSDVHVEPSRMTLHRFGNTSSSSLWYELAYIEAKGRMHKFDRVLMIAFGSGYKCNIAVWECIQTPKNADGPWTNCILRYPVKAR